MVCHFLNINFLVCFFIRIKFYKDSPAKYYRKEKPKKKQVFTKKILKGTKIFKKKKKQKAGIWLQMI